MITKTELLRLWSEISPILGQNVGRRADPEHPLDFFITYDEKPNMQLMLLTDFQLSLPKSSKQIYVRGNTRADGQNAACFSLEDSSLKDQFISLRWDMMDCSYEITDKKSAAKCAIRRFSMWQKLFAEAKTQRMSETKVKGLIGELCVIKEITIPQYGVEKGISGWVGPLGADRDFEFEDLWYESKYVSLSMDKVSISSLDQLDTDAPGVLILTRCEKTSETASDYISLNSLVDEISKMAENEENAVTTFNNRLSLAGYNAADELAKQPYTFYRFEKYLVKDNHFPRIRRSALSEAVSEGEYQLSIPALQQWKVE